MTRRAVDLLLDTLPLRGGADRDVLQERWRTTDLDGLRQLTVFEGAALWLSRRLNQRDIRPPDAFRLELRTAVHEATLLNMRIDAQTLAVFSLLRDASIPCVLIKGQARRAAVALYPYADARPISDVDLLVPEAAADSAWTLLCRSGFRRVYDESHLWTADHHRPVLINDAGVGVELHTTTAMSIPPTEAWRRVTDAADGVLWNGVATAVPNCTELVWQALSHSVADGVRGYYLRSFLSVAAILSEAPPVDWSLIEHRLRIDEVVCNETLRPVAQERIRRFLAVAAALAGVDIPAKLSARSAVGLSVLLDWRSQILRSPFGRAAKERFLEEGLRTEALLPMSPPDANGGAIHGVRRRSSAVVARVAYVTVRAARLA